MALCLIHDAFLANSSGYSPVQVWYRLGIILALMLVLAGVAAMIRRRLMRQDDTPPIGFTLKDLRDMHAAGQISDEELAQAEAKTLAQTRSAYLDDEDESDAPDESVTLNQEAEDLGDITPDDAGPEDGDQGTLDPDKNP